jgi:hypothetical protein
MLIRATAFALMLSFAVAVSGAHAAAPTATVRCGAFHFVRTSPTGNELGTTSISLRNAGTTSVTIERFTVRNFFGDVVHDSGPAIGVPHPLNFDIVPAQDITTVPPGASYYLGTNHIWGNDSVAGPAGNQQGFSMSVDVQYSGGPKTDLRVGSSLRVRERIFVGSPSGPVPTQGIEHSRSTAACGELN